MTDQTALQKAKWEGWADGYKTAVREGLIEIETYMDDLPADLKRRILTQLKYNWDIKGPKK